MHKKLKARAHFADRTPAPVSTGGEIFTDGTAIELVRQTGDPERASLLYWDGESETIGPVVERNGRIYEPVAINRSIWRELVLPSHSAPCRPTRELLSDLCKSASHFVGLPEKFASIVGRTVLASWIIRAILVAPVLSIIGPDGPRANRLVEWLRCVCRHPLPVSGVNPAALRSLPSGLELTILISQPTVSDQLEKLLDEAARRDQKILHRGNLLDLFGLQVIRSESVVGVGTSSFRSLRIPMLPGTHDLPNFDTRVQERIACDFQPKLLGYRFVNFQEASALRFDASRFTRSLRGLAHSLAATTPDDAQLQGELIELLREEDLDLRSAKWVELDIVAIESVSFACIECKGQAKYVGELAEVAQEIRRRRGVDEKIDPGVFGKKLGALGFEKEPRDANGIKLRLSDALCSRAQQLARDFDIPEVESDGDWLEATGQRSSEFSKGPGPKCV